MLRRPCQRWPRGAKRSRLPATTALRWIASVSTEVTRAAGSDDLEALAARALKQLETGRRSYPPAIPVLKHARRAADAAAKARGAARLAELCRALSPSFDTHGDP